MKILYYLKGAPGLILLIKMSGEICINDHFVYKRVTVRFYL